MDPGFQVTKEETQLELELPVCRPSEENSGICMWAVTASGCMASCMKCPPQPHVCRTWLLADELWGNEGSDTISDFISFMCKYACVWEWPVSCICIQRPENDVTWCPALSLSLYSLNPLSHLPSPMLISEWIHIIGRWLTGRRWGLAGWHGLSWAYSLAMFYLRPSCTLFSFFLTTILWASLLCHAFHTVVDWHF